MNRIPIVFSLDRRMAEPFVVCATSLLHAAASDTHYDLFVLHDAAQADDAMYRTLRSIETQGRCSLTLLDVQGAWSDAFEVRGITVATYYRLMIPDLLPDYDRVIYADVDMIFRSDLYEVFSTSLKGGELVAGVREVDDYTHLLSEADRASVKLVHDYYASIGCDTATYISNGFLVMNLQAMRKEGIVARFQSHAGKQYLTQDQDIVNIVCRGRIELLPFRWNYTSILCRWAHTVAPFRQAHAAEIEQAERIGTVHYSGVKPWNGFCLRYDIWWNAWRKSPLFDPAQCFTAESRIIDSLNRPSSGTPLKALPAKWLNSLKKRIKW